MFYEAIIDKNAFGLITFVDVYGSTKDKIYGSEVRGLSVPVFDDLPFVKDYKVGDKVEYFYPISCDGAVGYRRFNLKIYDIEKREDKTIIHFEVIE